MPRSIWRGAISFGLVNVPVKLYSAVSKKSVRFNQLHATDHARINMKRVCSVDGEEVPFEQIVKGYEISPDQYVVIEPAELEALDPKKTRTIDIEDFVDIDQIDPLYYEHPYYLMPDTGAAKAYKLLLQALRDSGKVAIARVVIRQKEYLTAIRPAGDGRDVLTMETMLFSDELIDPQQIDEFPDPDVRATEREVQMAQQLVESLSTDFDPSKYHDTYREQVLELIERKASGEEIAVQAVPEEPQAVPDLMAALEASLAAARDGKDKEPAAKSGNGAAPKPRAKAKPKASPSKASPKSRNGAGTAKRPSSKPATKRAKTKA
jgi:DNA end-binding protein Ku